MVESILRDGTGWHGCCRLPSRAGEDEGGPAADVGCLRDGGSRPAVRQCVLGVEFQTARCGQFGNLVRAAVEESLCLAQRDNRRFVSLSQFVVEDLHQRGGGLAVDQLASRGRETVTGRPPLAS